MILMYFFRFLFLNFHRGGIDPHLNFFRFWLPFRSHFQVFLGLCILLETVTLSYYSFFVGARHGDAIWGNAEEGPLIESRALEHNISGGFRFESFLLPSLFGMR
jgi:hypothetical protein